MPRDKPAKNLRNRPPSDRRLELAAELRAAGSTWEAVAAHVRRRPTTVRRWPAKYPDRWRQALHAAERRLAAEAGAESVFVLRRLLRSADDGHARQAAKSLIALRLDLARLDLRAAAGPTAAHPARLLVTLLETQTDEHLAQLVTADPGRPAGVDPAAPGDPPGGPG